MLGNFDYVTPLRYWCYKVLPLVYDDSLSYYELLSKVVAKLNEVIKTTNEIPKYIAELISDEKLKDIISEIMDELRSNIASVNDHNSSTATDDRKTGDLIWWKDYLYTVVRDMDIGDAYINYGENPNIVRTTVQELIEAVGDRVANLESYLRASYAKVYDNVAEMKADTTLEVGYHCVTLGYYSVNDGGGAEYKVVANNSGYGHFEELANGNGYAELILGNAVNARQIGAKGDKIKDDTDALIEGFNLAYNTTKVFYIPTGEYKCNGTMELGVNKVTGLKVYGEIGATGGGTIIYQYANAPVFDLKSGCEIDSLIFIGTDTPAYTSQIAIKMNNTNSVRINNCNFFLFYNCVEIVDTVFFSKISNCRFFSCTNAMIKSYESQSGISPGGFNVLFEAVDMVSVKGVYGYQLGNIGSFLMSDCEVAPQNLTGAGLFLESCAERAGMSVISNSGFEQPNHAIIIGTDENLVHSIYFENVYAGSGQSAVLINNAMSIYFTSGDITGGTLGSDGLVHFGKYANDIKFSNITFNTPVGCFTAESNCDNLDLCVDNCSYTGNIFLYVPNVNFTKIKRLVFDNCKVSDVDTMFSYPSGCLPIIRCGNDLGIISSKQVYKGTLDANGNAQVTVSQYGVNNVILGCTAYYRSGALMPVALSTQVTGATEIQLSGGVANSKYVLVVEYANTDIWA